MADDVSRVTYAEPALYDVAFGSNREAEVAFLLRCFRRYAKIRVRRVVDLGCGTGPHLLRLARRGYQVTGLDTSAANLAYVAVEAARRRLGVTLAAQDMASFRLPARVDAAICLQNSQAYLLTNDAMVEHFRAVAAALRCGGLYIFDRYIMSAWADPVRQWSWSRQRGRVAVRARVSLLDDIDPVGQTFRERVVLEALGEGAPRGYRHAHRVRMVFPQELRTLVRLAGGFELVGWFAAFSLRRPLERARGAVMMVTALRRR